MVEGRIRNTPGQGGLDSNAVKYRPQQTKSHPLMEFGKVGAATPRYHERSDRRPEHQVYRRTLLLNVGLGE